MRGIGTETHICHNKKRWERFTYYRNCFDDWIQGGSSRTACGILCYNRDQMRSTKKSCGFIAAVSARTAVRHHVFILAKLH